MIHSFFFFSEKYLYYDLKILGGCRKVIYLKKKPAITRDEVLTKINSHTGTTYLALLKLTSRINC